MACRDRLPRPRGDGPTPNTFALRVLGAPPPTRGWTPGTTGGHEAQEGSPAHAGMDLVASSKLQPSSWLPRPRGDGPVGTDTNRPVSVAPPPTRGWTPKWGRMHGDGRGSPAHAGMDPVINTRSPFSVRLPRPRGDGPGGRHNCARSDKAPPPTRGWTGAPRHERIRVPGSPAHAGMDRSRRASRAGAGGLPRPRGDGPDADPSNGCPEVAPPPTRGWTRRDRGLGVSAPGSPAHAGMDRRRRLSRETIRRLPRPRGDGLRCARFGEIDDRKPGFVPSRSIPVTGSQSAKILQITDMADAVQPHQGNSPYSTLRMISRIRRRPSNVSQRSMGRPLPRAGRAVPSQS